MEVPQRRSISPAWEVALSYFVVAGLWIQTSVSDLILGFFVVSPERLVALSVFKGLAFVVVTSILLFFFVQGSFRKIQTSYRALEFSEALTWVAALK